MFTFWKDPWIYATILMAAIAGFVWGMWFERRRERKRSASALRALQTLRTGIARLKIVERQGSHEG